MDFKDKVVIVTGSSSGIGAAAAQHFARLNAKIVIVGRNEDRLKKIEQAIEDASGNKPLVIKAEMTKDDDVNNIIEETIKEFGQIDVLVNNAGAGIVAKVKDGVQHFDKMISTNLRSVYLLTSLAIPYLIKTKGNIVNISSVAAIAPVAFSVPYSIAKAGLDMLTRCTAKELAGNGVRVNSVSPGPVRTNFIPALGFSEEQANAMLDARLKQTPLGHFSTSEDVAELIIFLASDKARSITGSLYLHDNGELLIDH